MSPPASAGLMVGVALSAGQWASLALVWVLFFLLPALWLARKAKRDGDEPFVWFFLAAFGSIMGILEYYHHRSILRRRAKRAARADGAKE